MEAVTGATSAWTPGDVWCVEVLFGAGAFFSEGAFLFGDLALVSGCPVCVSDDGEAVPCRLSRWPGSIRSGSDPMVVRLPAYSRRQPPWTCCSPAMPERVSPCTTVYISARPARDCGVVCGCTSRTDEVLTGWVVALSVWMSGAPPPRVSPARTEHTGQAPGPCPSRTFSATAICWSLEARSARAAYRVPP